MKTIITKKLLIYCVFSFVATTFSFAQNWVSTSPQNKKVVLEEFTGIKCTYCPDGHKRANELKAANEGNVFLVNIHSGGYATPGAGEPDMRTPEGDIIDNASGLTGYPAGSVNRAKDPRAENRDKWSASANTILSQSSPVNAYVKAYFDRETRELTTEVELYYTANGSADNKLTVMLTQDNILGPQTGGTRFNPDNYVGGNYIHNHVLRDVITEGAWGETITETNEGDYTYKKYVTVLPENIKNIPLKFNYLNVVAFVSESDNNNILTGHEAKVDFDRTGALDLSLAVKSPLSNGLCMNYFQPSVEVTNSSNETVNSFDLTATVNGLNYSKSFEGSIAPGGKTSVELNQYIFPRGEFSFSIKGFENINGGNLFDTIRTNDAIEFNGIGFQENAFTYNKFGLNSYGQASNIGRWIKTNSQFLYSTNVGKVGGSMLYYLHESRNIAGKPGDIVLGGADFTSITDPVVSYYYAYTDGGENGTAPSIDVKVSEDCGVSFQSVKLTQCQSTGEVQDPRYIWAPKSEEFRQVSVDLSAYAGKSVLISVAGIPGSSGNSLYIDEIEVGSASKIASVDDIEVQGLSVYPNPANNSLNVSIERKENAKATLISLQGNVISEFDIINGSATLNTSSISEGLYIINVKSGESTSAIKVNIKH